jgi:hypothetical protein
MLPGLRRRGACLSDSAPRSLQSLSHSLLVTGFPKTVVEHAERHEHNHVQIEC